MKAVLTPIPTTAKNSTSGKLVSADIYAPHHVMKMTSGAEPFCFYNAMLFLTNNGENRHHGKQGNYSYLDSSQNRT